MLHTRSYIRSVAVALALLVIACSDKDDKPWPGQRFEARVGKVDVKLLLHDCKVYQITGRGRSEKRALVLQPEFYPFFTSCMRESLTSDGEYILAQLGRQAFGAGGCCAAGGTYRSRDGIEWEVRKGGQWHPAVEKAKPE